jgi:hypothetical protein
VRCTDAFVVKIKIYLFAWGEVLVELELGVKSFEVLGLCTAPDLVSLVGDLVGAVEDALRDAEVGSKLDNG